jgi:hypothetical protein
MLTRSTIIVGSECSKQIDARTARAAIRVEQHNVVVDTRCQRISIIGCKTHHNDLTQHSTTIDWCARRLSHVPQRHRSIERRRAEEMRRERAPFQHVDAGRVQVVEHRDERARLHIAQLHAGIVARAQHQSIVAADVCRRQREPRILAHHRNRFAVTNAVARRLVAHFARVVHTQHAVVGAGNEQMLMSGAMQPANAEHLRVGARRHSADQRPASLDHQ